MKNVLTVDKQIENCILALCNWAEVSEEHVVLEDWRCGSQACFGGHLATWDDFRAQGVGQSSFYGWPRLSNGIDTRPSDVSEFLFGSAEMFTIFAPDEILSLPKPPYERIVNRLENQITRLSTPLRLTSRFKD